MTQKNNSSQKAKPYGLKSLVIERFRNMIGLAIPLGQRITVLAGQNGTSKSTILGMLGQPFGMNSARTIFDKACRTKFTDIFKMSPEHDIPGDHVYYIDFRDEAIANGRQHVQVKSYARKETDRSHIRLVTGATRNEGDGNIDYPVIYLGMKRVYPVGEIANPEATDLRLSKEEVDAFIRWYSRIMVPISAGGIEPVRMEKRGQKETLLVNSGSYDYLANSAGQDNLGQILAAVISFQRLKTIMGSDYKGGLLLIDEMDATLFPASQIGLLNILHDVSVDLQLQIVLTTHSTDLIGYSLKLAKQGDDVEVIYLSSSGGYIDFDLNPPIESIRADLLIEPLPTDKKIKVEIWCEDAEAAWFLHKMIPQKLASKCSVQSAGLSCGELAELAIRDIPAIKNVIFVTDADGVKNASKKIRECPRLFVLPGDSLSPERSIYDLLDSLPDNSSDWNLFPRSYNKQKFTKLRNDAEDAWIRKGGEIDRKFEKAWFNKTKRDGLWGNNGSEIYKIWSKAHKTEIDEFCKRLEHRVDAILGRMEFEAS